jgi:hypothetical protein
LGIISLALVVAIASGQSKRELHIWLEQRGSVPVVPEWFSCISKMRYTTYDKAKAQSCLASILSHPEITSGKLTYKRHKNEDLLTFHVESPSLMVTDLDLGVSGDDLMKVREFSEINGNTLRLGEAYDPYREISTLLMFDLLFRSQGRRYMLSRTIYFDYAIKTFRETVRVWKGPAMDPERLVPPYVEPCQILNGNFNWIDADDFTPVEFIHTRMRTKWLGCFSEENLRHDREMLKGLPFLKESKISVSGSGGSRDFSFYFRSGSIPISQITVHGYGLLSDLSERDAPQLPLRVGDTYGKSKVSQVLDSLKKFYAKDDRQIKVFCNTEVAPSGEARLDFSVLAVPDDIVYINDKRFDVSTHDEPTPAATSSDVN